jgi:protein-S-isoprenylcysteine O-methyltransferase Ste14
MAYHDGHAPSNGAKTILLLFTLSGILLAATMLLGNSQISAFRVSMLLGCSVIFYLRLVLCLLVFVKRKVSWFEGCSVGVLYGVMVYMFSIWGSHLHDEVSVVDTVGMVLFITGSWVNSQSDYQRYKWKKKPENTGHLYTGGLFRYAMHINFLGDSVMFIGYALVTQNSMSFIPVTAIVLNFILFQIPRLDDYLLQRYGIEFTAYASKTKILIPFIY